MALTFNGTTQYLTRAGAVISATPLTFACWYNSASLTSSAALISISNQATNNSYWQMFVGTTGTVAARSEASGAGAQSATTTTLATGSWHHCAGVYVSSTSRTAYLDGVAATLSTISNTPSLASAVTAIGTAFNGSATATNLANGSIAFPAIWNIALSAADIATLALGMDPRRIHPEALISFPPLQGNSPEIDYMSSTTWTLTAAPTLAANPLLYTARGAIVPGPQPFYLSATMGAASGLSTAKVSVDLSVTAGAHSGLSAAKVDALLGTATVGAKAGLSTVNSLVFSLGSITLGARSGLTSATPVVLLKATTGSHAGLSTAKMSVDLSVTAGAHAGLSTIKVAAILGTTTVGAKSGITTGTLVNPLGTATLGAQAGLSTVNSLVFSLAHTTIGAKAGLHPVTPNVALKLTMGAHAGVKIAKPVGLLIVKVGSHGGITHATIVPPLVIFSNLAAVDETIIYAAWYLDEAISHFGPETLFYYPVHLDALSSFAGPELITSISGPDQIPSFLLET